MNEIKNNTSLDNSQFKPYNIERLLQIRSFYLITKEFFELHNREIQEKYNEESINLARNLGIEEVLALDFKPFFMNLLFIDIRTTLEIYFNGVLGFIFVGNLDVLKNSNKQYSTEEILSHIHGVGFLIDFLVEKEIKKFNEKNSKCKIEYLKKLLNKKNILNETLINQFIEVSEIRNLLVHNEGYINERFEKTVDNPRYKTCSQIIVDEEMLLEAIDSMISFINAIDKELCEKFRNISVGYDADQDSEVM